MLKRVKLLINRCIRKFGAVLVSTRTLQYWERQSQVGVLRQITRINEPIGTVLDVGAAHGEWTLACARILPNARYELFEPLGEFRSHLKSVCSQLPRASYHNVALHREPGKMSLNVHPDLVGSSFYIEKEDSDVNGQLRIVPTASLDSICDSLELELPFLLKIDVQGAEIDVLAGATHTLENCAFVICECSFFDFYDGGGTVDGVLRTMRNEGFALYDIFGLSHRPLDGALAQADLCFVKANGPFRRLHQFATAAQRREITERLLRNDADRLR